MDATHGGDAAVSQIAAAIGEPARARMLFCLMDGHARTSTELAVVANVSPSTASVHLHRLKASHLVTVVVQGKHRYYSLESPHVASALEGLSVIAGGVRGTFAPHAPSRLRGSGHRRRRHPDAAPPVRVRLSGLDGAYAARRRGLGRSVSKNGANAKVGGPGSR